MPGTEDWATVWKNSVALIAARHTLEQMDERMQHKKQPAARRIDAGGA